MNPAAPIVVAQISDPHLRAEEPWRVDQLAAAIDTVLAAGVELAAVLLTGDIADHGAPAEYAPVPKLLDRCTAPVIVIAGNHDDRGAMRTGLALNGGADDPIQSVAALAGVRIVACDTVIPGATAGDLDVDWLAARLAEDRQTPTLVVMHHAPLDIASVEMDAIGLPRTTRERLAGVLAGAPNVAGVLCGHVHRTISGRLGCTPVFAAPSCTAQLSFDPPGGREIAWTDDPPAIALHVLLNGQLVSHHVPVAAVPREGGA